MFNFLKKEGKKKKIKNDDNVFNSTIITTNSYDSGTNSYDSDCSSSDCSSSDCSCSCD